MLSLLRARSQSPHAARDCARRRSRSLNILTARKPMGLSPHHQLLLLASHRMALTIQRKNPSWIAREIEFFSIFAWSVPTLVSDHNSRFRIFSSRICFSRFMKHLAKMASHKYNYIIRHPSVWVIGYCHSGWQFCRRPGFDSCQLAGQAEKWHWEGNFKIQI